MTNDYESLANRLAATGLLVTVAELHGMVCGQLSATHGDYAAGLTGKVLGQDSVPAELFSLLQDMAGEARDQLEEAGGFSFMPLLPDDDEDIGLRLHALGRWCEGYTLGYAAACSAAGAALPDEAREVLADFSRIAEVETADGDEDEESDYMEVIEYVRVAAASLYAADPDGSQSEPEPVVH